MKKIKSAFTLVELIVVITILAILGTIAFLSMQGYSANARDGVRTTDLANISKSLELYSLKTGNYPFPSTSVDITYSGGLAWKQGTFGTEPFNQVGNINKLPTDPLTGNEYTYSVTESKGEFQVAGVYEGSLSKNKELLSKTYANGNVNGLARIVGNYNGLTISVQSGSTTFILAVPTIISGDITDSNLQTIIDNKKLSYNGFKNLPASYSGSKFNADNTSFNFIPNPLIVYSGNLNTLKTSEPTRIQLLKNIQTAYSGTILANDTNISGILAIPTNTVTPSSQTKTLASSILKNNLGISSNFVNNSNPITSCDSQPSYSGAVFTAGNPTSINQAWQSMDSNNPCYWTCGTGKVLLGNDCVSENCAGTTPDGTTTLTSATSTAGGTWNYNTTPGVCTYSCNTGAGYIRSGNSCILPASCTGTLPTSNYSTQIGTLIQNTAWQNTNAGNPCYYSCTNGYTGNNCDCGQSITYGGYTYTTISLPSGKCWTSTNMKHGSMINGTSNPSDINTIEKWCYNNDVNNCNTYGGLYSWREAMGIANSDSISSNENFSKSVCGVLGNGWRLPSVGDWNSEGFYNGNNVDGWLGTKLKGIMTNLPGNYYKYNGLPYFEAKDFFIYYRTSEQSVAGSYTWTWFLRGDGSSLGMGGNPVTGYGMSVVCVRN